MRQALIKYQTMKLHEEWNTSQTAKDKVFTLKAKLQKLKPKVKSDKKKKEFNVTEDKTKNQSWFKPQMRVPPKEGEPHTKVENNKTYQRCPKHTQWTRHTPEECTYNPNKELDKKHINIQDGLPKLKLKQAHQSTLNNETSIWMMGKLMGRNIL